LRAANSESGRRLVLSALAALALIFQTSLALGAAESPVPITTDGDTPLRFHVRAIVENGTPLSPEYVAEHQDTALPHPRSPPNYGRFNVPVWGYVAVVNKLPRREWVLRYTLGTVEDVRVYIRSQDEAGFHQLEELGTGATALFAGFRSATFLITLPPDVPVEVVTRLHTRAPVGFHLVVSSTIEFFETDRHLIATAATLGVVPLVVLIYIAILATVLRHRGLLSAMVMLLSKLILDAWVTGFASLIFPFISRTVWPTFGFVMVGVFHMSCVLHMRRYLDLPRMAPQVDRLLLAGGTLFVVLSAIEISGLANVRFWVQFFAPFLFLAMMATAAWDAWRRPSVGAFCYALAWVIFFCESAILLVRLLALVPINIQAAEFAQTAAASILLGAAIFRRIKDQDQALNLSLAESNERFQLAIEGSAAAIWEYVAPTGRFFYVPRLAQLVAVPFGTSLPRLLATLPRPARRQLLADIRRSLADRARYFRTEIEQDNGDGSTRHLAVTGAIQYEESGARQRICGSVIDITSERALATERQLTAALAREKDRAERALTARTIFYAAANHDLRHPLLSLGLYLQMLAKNTTLDRLKDLLPRMQEAHRSVFGYVDHILDLARTDAGSAPPAPALQPLQPIFTKLIDQYQADAVQASLSLRVVPTTAAVVTDAFLLDRILSNLLSNAIRNTRSGGVLLGCRRLSDGLRIDVVDTGPGVPNEIHQRVLNGRLTGANSDASGSVQLGLIIVQRTAEELGCTIDMVTRAGHGTRVSVIIRS
jgi:signal transduction histidine kinase